MSKRFEKDLPDGEVLNGNVYKTDVLEFIRTYNT